MAKQRSGNPNRGMSLWYQVCTFVPGLVLWAMARSDGNYRPVALYGIVAGIAYYGSLWAHPLRNCWKCKGGGKDFGWIWNYGSTQCQRCNGMARVPRFGTWLFGVPHTGWRVARK